MVTQSIGPVRAAVGLFLALQHMRNPREVQLPNSRGIG
jgi:hypothetical protein